VRFFKWVTYPDAVPGILEVLRVHQWVVNEPGHERVPLVRLLREVPDEIPRSNRLSGLDPDEVRSPGRLSQEEAVLRELGDAVSALLTREAIEGGHDEVHGMLELLRGSQVHMDKEAQEVGQKPCY
jgi:hypothetical protein